MAVRYYSQHIEQDIGPSLRMAWRETIMRGMKPMDLVQRAIDRGIGVGGADPMEIGSRVMFMVAGLKYLGQRNLVEDAVAAQMLTNAAAEAGLPRRKAETCTSQGEVVGGFLRAGCRIYEVSDALAARLTATDIRGVPSVMAELPFESIAIRVPSMLGDREIIVAEIPSQPLPAGVMEAVRQEDGTWNRSDLDPDMSEEWSKGVTVRTFQIAVVSYDGAVQRPDNHVGTAPKGSILTLSLPSKMSVEECLKKAEEVGEEAVATLKFVLNLALYLSWPDTGDPMPEVVADKFKDLQSRLKRLPKGPKRDRVKEQLKTTFAERRILVGTHLPRVEFGGDGIPVTVRTLVAGHWKHQPYGQGRAERRLIRIEPYWRGPLDAPDSKPTRVVK